MFINSKDMIRIFKKWVKENKNDYVINEEINLRKFKIEHYQFSTHYNNLSLINHINKRVIYIKSTNEFIIERGNYIDLVDIKIFNQGVSIKYREHINLRINLIDIIKILIKCECINFVNTVNEEDLDVFKGVHKNEFYNDVISDFDEKYTNKLMRNIDDKCIDYFKKILNNPTKYYGCINVYFHSNPILDCIGSILWKLDNPLLYCVRGNIDFLSDINKSEFKTIYIREYYYTGLGFDKSDKFNLINDLIISWIIENYHDKMNIILITNKKFEYNDNVKHYDINHVKRIVNAIRHRRFETDLELKTYIESFNDETLTDICFNYDMKVESEHLIYSYGNDKLIKSYSKRRLKPLVYHYLIK